MYCVESTLWIDTSSGTHLEVLEDILLASPPSLLASFLTSKACHFDNVTGFFELCKALLKMIKMICGYEDHPEELHYIGSLVTI